MRRIKIFMICIVASLSMWGCKETDNESDGSSKLTNVTFTATPGGGYFTYTVPSDPEFLYVRADYVIDNGQKISKTCSKFTKRLYIEGFLEPKSDQITLYAVDKNDKATLSSVETVTPLRSTVLDVADNIVFGEGVSSVYFDVSNPVAQKTIIYLSLKNGDDIINKAYINESPNARYIIMPLENKTYRATVYTADTYGNKSPVRDLGDITPQEDFKLNKRKWKILSSENIPLEMVAEDRAVNDRGPWNDDTPQYLFDDVVDVGSFANYCNTDAGFPYSYYIDLGRSVRLSRVVTWQRRFAIDPWNQYQVAQYELWGSNTMIDGKVVNWSKIGIYSLVKPDNELEAHEMVENGYPFLINPETNGFSSPVRYVRYRVKKNFIIPESSVTESFTSEITFYGVEVE